MTKLKDIEGLLPDYKDEHMRVAVAVLAEKEIEIDVEKVIQIAEDLIVKGGQWYKNRVIAEAISKADILKEVK